MPFRDWFLDLIGRGPRHEAIGQVPQRGAATHVIILDGTMSSLREGCETNAGLTYKLLAEQGARSGMTIFYEAGIQWRDWRGTWDVMAGRGINRQIRRAYGHLASKYRAGDRIILLGYSRGAYAVRSLAGVIDRVGLLQRDKATVRHIREVYRHYQRDPDGAAAREFARLHCHGRAPIEAVAVWDTVKALGLKFPLIWRWTQARHAFHSPALGGSVLHGFHALALDETRAAYEPVIWETDEDWDGRVEQVWFRGCHGDVGGQLDRNMAARPLANIPLVWMLDRLERCGVSLPEGWAGRFEQDVTAPSVGNWRGWGKLFLMRGKRRVGRDRSERVHESVNGVQSENSMRALESETP